MFRFLQIFQKNKNCKSGGLEGRGGERGKDHRAQRRRRRRRGEEENGSEDSAEVNHTITHKASGIRNELRKRRDTSETNFINFE